MNDTRTLHWVTAAFLLLDDFTGKVIPNGKVVFSLEGKRLAPLRKGDGILVITNLPQGIQGQLQISVPAYLDYLVSDISRVKEPDGINVLRLTPGTGYASFPEMTAYGATFRDVLHAPLARLPVALHAPFPEKGVKINTFSGSNSSQVHLTNPYGADLTGLTLSLGPEEIEQPPFEFTLVKELDRHRYEIEAKEQQALNPLPEGACLRRVYRSVTDEQGQVLIPVHPPKGEATLSALVLAGELPTLLIKKVLLIEGQITQYIEVVDLQGLCK